MNLKTIRILLILVFFLFLFSFVNYVKGSAEILGLGGVVLEDSGFSSLYNPSMTVFNRNYINIVGNANLLYSNIEDVNLKNYSFGMEYKNKKKWAVSASGTFLKIETFQNLIGTFSGSYKVMPSLSTGLGYQLDIIKSSYENFSAMKHNLIFSASYKWKFLLSSIGSVINDLSQTKDFSPFLDMKVSIASIVVGLRNVYAQHAYKVSFGLAYHLNSNLIFRGGINFNSLSFGIGVIPQKSIIINYAINMNQALGYSHAIDVKFFL